MYFPYLSEANRSTIVQGYLLEKAERERQEEAARQTHNRAAAQERAEALITAMDNATRRGAKR
jgi:hypothetical protein